jgi:hypothetical protein
VQRQAWPRGAGWVALILNFNARRLTEGIRRYWMNSNVWFFAGKI